jgi:hypothetical protein
MMIDAVITIFGLTTSLLLLLDNDLIIVNKCKDRNACPVNQKSSVIVTNFCYSIPRA